MHKYQVQYRNSKGQVLKADVAAHDYRNAAEWVLNNCADVVEVLGVIWVA